MATGAGENWRKWWVLGAMGAILGVILLDETVVGVALPTIQTDLAMSELASHWVVNVYMLVLAGLAAAAGRLGDIVGHKWVMLIGLALFGLASLASGLAENTAWLILARGIQGAGAAVIFPTSLAMVTIVFAENQRGMALGVYGAIGTSFLALGPLVGGFLTDYASWRWIFWVNPPVVFVIGLTVLAAWVEPQRDSSAQRMDWTGLILLVSGLGMVVFAMMQGPDWGWTDPAVLPVMAVGVILLAGFVVLERRVAKPLIEVGLLAHPTVAGANLVTLTAQYSKMSVFVFGALYFQDILKMTPLMAGVALLPTVAPQFLTAPLAGLASDRWGPRLPALAGVLALAASTAWIAVAVFWNSYAVMAAGLLIWGLSMAFLFVPTGLAVMNAVPRDKQGEAGGIIMSSQLLGAAVGMALCSTVFSISGAFHAVFVVNAIIAVVVLVVAWLTIAPRAEIKATPTTAG